MIDIRLIAALVACSTVAACQFGGGGSPDAEQPRAGSSVRTAPAAAVRAPGTIVGAGVNETYDCGGGPVTVSGYQNTIHFVGACPALTITGYANTITVDKARAITVTGHSNTLTWGSGISGDPTITNTGSANTIKHGAGDPGTNHSAPPAGSDGSGGPGGGQIVISGDATARTAACDGGKSVVISGHAGHVVLTGRCTKVTVTGDADHITINSTGRLEVTGDDNVIMAGGSPQISDTGDNNAIGG